MLNRTPYASQAPAALCLITQDLPLLWASLVAFRESVPGELTETHRQIDRILIALEQEQARRYAPPLAPAGSKMRPTAIRPTIT